MLKRTKIRALGADLNLEKERHVHYFSIKNLGGTVDILCSGEMTINPYSLEHII